MRAVSMGAQEAVVVSGGIGYEVGQIQVLNSRSLYTQKCRARGNEKVGQVVLF